MRQPNTAHKETEKKMTDTSDIRFDPAGFFLLRENRFRNDKAFYEEKKEEIKRLVTLPMRQLAAQIDEAVMVPLDPGMELNPVRQVSRVRRDTRFTRDKTLYRANMWTMFRRAENAVPFPAFWFEIHPDEEHWSCGICALDDSPASMRIFQEKILAEPDAFLCALASAQCVGATPCGERYKRDRHKPENEALTPFVNAKSFAMQYKSADLGPLFDGTIAARLKLLYAALSPLYRWMGAFGGAD
jgi:uncharacterized protein (DUF2461 family)